MKRTLISLLTLFLFTVSVATTGFAAGNEWTIKFLANGTMDSGGITSKQKGEAKFDDAIGDLEPGDTELFEFHIKNEHAQTTRWYMLNEVLASLERSTREGMELGGAYTYKLEYQGPGTVSEPGGVRPLFDSSRIGGEDDSNWDKVGLEEATSDLAEYFFLDTLNTGESGTVKLTVHLEGDTQGNSYQNTAAKLALRFAVELANSSTNINRRTAVKTGDENNLIPYYIAMIVTGLLFLYFALDAYTDKLYKKGKE